MHERSVIVVGAGLAGLIAADALVAAGWDVTVIEARDRVGGRTWSDTASNGARIERGAEWVEDGHTHLIALCNRFGTPLVNAGMSYHDRRPIGGPPVSDEELVTGRKHVRELLRVLGNRVYETSVAEAIDRLNVSDGVRVAFRARVECTAGTPAADLSATHLEMLAHAPDNADSLRIGTGSDAPALALATLLGSRIRLGEPVAQLDLSEAGTNVTTTGGTYRASQLVLALPAAIVREAPFLTVLPAPVAIAVNTLGIAQAAKLFVPLTGVTTPAAHLDVQRDYWVWTANEGDAGLRPILAGFAGSQPMLDLLEVEQGVETWAKRVAEMRPDLPLDLDNAGLQTWHDDPYAKGVYTCLRPGPRPDLSTLRRSHDRLVLAGEYTDDEYAGYMEGAVRSGQRAASLIDPTLAGP